jgi:hypothetical protein
MEIKTARTEIGYGPQVTILYTLDRSNLELSLGPPAFLPYFLYTDPHWYLQLAI